MLNIYQAGYHKTWKDPHAYSHVEWNGGLVVPPSLQVEASALVHEKKESFGIVEIKKENIHLLQKKLDAITNYWGDEATPAHSKAHARLNHDLPETVTAFVKAKELYMHAWTWICELIDITHDLKYK